MKPTAELRNVKRMRIEHVGEDGGMGLIRFPESGYAASVIWSTGGGWDHVSVSPFDHKITPSWEDMCRLKDMFFRDDEVVVQFHPAKNEYVNMLSNCLHLWRPQTETLPTPPSIMVGLKDGQTAEEAKAEIEKLRL